MVIVVLNIQIIIPSLIELKLIQNFFRFSVLKTCGYSENFIFPHFFSIFGRNFLLCAIESLSQTDLQALKRAEIEGLAEKWSQGKHPMHLAMFLDILTPIKVQA